MDCREWLNCSWNVDTIEVNVNVYATKLEKKTTKANVCVCVRVCVQEIGLWQ